jgi:glutaredoxin
VPQIDVMMYTLSTCPWCRKTKQFFTDRGVPYEFCDVDKLKRSERMEARDKVVELTGSLQYPVVIINGTVIQGYNPDQYTDQLEKAGWQTEEE